MAYRRKPQQQQQILSAPSSFSRGSTKAQGEGDEDEVTKSWDWSDDDDSHHSVGNVDESTAPSLAAKAIRASSGARRDSSLSSAYAAHSSYTRKPLPNASLSNFSPAIQKDSVESSYQYTSMKNLGEPKLGGFWSTLAKKAKAIIEDDISSPKSATMSPGAAGEEAKSLPKLGSQGEHTKEFQSPENHQRSNGAGLHKGLGSIASSLTHIGGTIGNALEEGLSIVENRAVDIIQETRKFQVRRKSGAPGFNELVKNDYHKSKKPEKQPTTYPQTESDMEIQLKASRDVAMAMAAKTKVLLRELKTVKADFAFAKERCAQLEEENRVLRESLEKGDNPEDDDLVRLQLETLLAEKARLAHENSVYARENRFLREIVEYHQLTMQDVIYLDESNEEVSQVYPVGANMRSLSSPKTDDI